MITKKQLRKIVIEKLSKVEKRKSRLKAVFSGYDDGEVVPKDMKALGRGILRTEFNKNHSGNDGKFTDGKDDGSCSDGKSQKIRKKDKCGASSADCGRKGDKWCRNGKKRTPSGMISEDEDNEQMRYLRGIIKNEIESAIRGALASKEKRSGCTRKDILDYINSYEKASKGRLHAKKK
tara:strand:- start:89 stop:622 length:534 start_codon:yes stop_codon:yes gene_type:complete